MDGLEGVDAHRGLSDRRFGFFREGPAMKELKQPRAKVTREKVVGEAGRLFALKGYHDTKLEEILQGAGVTTGAFFHHFQGKEDLAFAVIDAHMARRRELLDRIERSLPDAGNGHGGPLAPVFRRLDAIAEMIRHREDARGGCVIGNLSTALSDTHDGFRRRLAECFDEMAREFQPHLDAAARATGLVPEARAAELAHYIVSVIEGAIMLARTHRDPRLPACQFAHLKEHLRKNLDG
jgi:TetR/AcrR family transcriptional repressor of nem operon